MLPAKISLPYIDLALEHIQLGDSDVEKVFGHHVHWGYWADPSSADGSLDDFAAAAEQLSQKVYAAANVKTGDLILDAGCGFGGTIASLNKQYNQLSLVGLNIDPRQLERAKQTVHPQPSNQISFVEGDACQLPFADASFDVVLAVECIFHFPSRAAFFQEARRVLRPGGKLAICDFVPISIFQPIRLLLTRLANSSVSSTFGRVNSEYTLADYTQLAKDTGFTLTLKEDITTNTLPTYPVVRRLYSKIGKTNSAKVVTQTEQLSRFGLVRYLILSFTAT